jgi:hypothetical protein
MVILFAPLTCLVLSLMTVGIGHSLSIQEDKPVQQTQVADHKVNSAPSGNEVTP